MIDINLISIAINKHKNCLENFNKITDSLYVVNDFFPLEVLTKLHEYIYNTKDWNDQTVKLDSRPVFNKSPARKRSRLLFKHDTVLEETHIIVENFTSYLNNIFKKQLEFNGYEIWRDSAGYLIPTHSDNPDIAAAMQIFLSEHATNLGTVFNLQTPTRIPYKINSGYLMNNEDKITHQMMTPVPDDHVRYSLYATWKFPNK